MTFQGEIIVRDAPRTCDRRGDRGRSERAWRRRPSTGVAAPWSAPADLAASGALAAISIATAVASHKGAAHNENALYFGQGEIIVRDAPRTCDRRGDRGRSERAWRRRPSTGVAAPWSAPAVHRRGRALVGAGRPGRQRRLSRDFNRHSGCIA